MCPPELLGQYKNELEKLNAKNIRKKVMSRENRLRKENSFN
jgi:hypothetical protein